MIGCGLIFITAGVQKLRHRHILAGVVANYRILPAGLVAPVSTALPPAEILIGALLLVGPVPLATIAAVALLLTFATAMAVNLGRGRHQIHCGCGRLDLQQRLGWGKVFFNLLLAALMMIPTDFAQPFDAMAHASALFAGGALWILHLLFESIGAVKAFATPLPSHAPNRSR
nr:MauE/DoxX family redox-associated membrane protein [Sphingobium fontiphilum]